MKHQVPLLLLLLLGTTARAAEPGWVELQASPGGSWDLEACSGSSLVARDRRSESTRSLEVDLALQRPTRLELEAGSWDLELVSATCWMQESSVEVSSNVVTHLRAELHRSAEVRGMLELPAGASPPERLRLLFDRSFRAGEGMGADQSPSGSTLCEIGDGGVFRCPVPEGTLDLRLSAPGYAPEYWWGCAIEPARPVRVGRVVLRPGAALVGWVATEDGSELDHDLVEATLVPRGLAQPTSRHEEFQREASSTPGSVDASGFFRFTSLSEGEYVLAVSAPGFAPSTVGVAVVEGMESNLRDPILLAPPRTLSVVVEPATRPDGSTWLFDVVRIDRYRSYFESVFEAEVPETGWIDIEGLSDATYMVRVSDLEGNQVAAHEVDLASEPMPYRIEIGSVFVEGGLRLGRDPLEGTIWFGTRTGGEKVEVRTDEEGFYSTALPRPGRWPVEVIAEAPPVRRKIGAVEVPEPTRGAAVELDLRLPATRIRGEVVDESGLFPGGSAIVYAVPRWFDERSSVNVAETDGRFDLRGLPEGVLRIHAEGANTRSETVALQLVDGMEATVRLTLRPYQEVHGRVVTPDGLPVPGASILLLPSDDPVFPSRKASTDASGSFVAQVAAGKRHVLATISSPGRTLGVFEVELDGQPLLLELPAEGGMLDLEVDRSTLALGSPSLLLVYRNGKPFPLGEIESWAAIHPVEPREDDRFVVKQLAEGAYEACLVPSDEYTSWMVGFHDSGRCATGYLPRFGQLAMNLRGID